MAGLYEAGTTVQALKRQELGDALFVAESTDHPMSRLLPRGPKPKQMLSEWPVQAYGDPSFDGTVDGTDHSTYEAQDADSLNGTGMLLESPGWLVSTIAGVTELAGIPNLIANARTDDALMHARKTERQLLSTMDCRQGNGAQAYRSRGMFSWLQTTAQTVLPVPAAFRPSSDYSSTLAALTPVTFEALLQAAALEKKGAVDLELFAGIKLKTRMSKWAQHDTDVSGETVVARYNLDASEKMFMSIVDFFKFDAGMVRSFLSYHLAYDSSTGAATAYSTRSGVLVDLDMWKLRFLLKPTHVPQPNLGGGERGFHQQIHLLECSNPLGQRRLYISADS
jgi:hypothetical protein